MHLMHNSIDWLIAYFGVVKTGAWVVPLNFRFDGSDISYCSDVAEPDVMVFGEEFTDRIGSVRDRLHSVKHFVEAGNEASPYAESFSGLIAGIPLAARRRDNVR